MQKRCDANARHSGLTSGPTVQSPRGSQVRSRLAGGGKRIRTAGPSRKRVVSPTEREMPRERKGESRASGGEAASHREPIAIFAVEVLPQYASNLDDGT